MAASSFFVPAGPLNPYNATLARERHAQPNDSIESVGDVEPNTFIWDSATSQWVPVIGGGGGTGTTDHGALTGLTDDDHPQYVKDTGDTMTGYLKFDAPVGSADYIELLEGGVRRWLVGKNTATSFVISRYDSSATSLGSPVVIEAPTGLITLRYPSVGGVSVPPHDTDWCVINPANGWTASGIRIRRFGNQVTLRVNGLSPANRASPVFAYIPFGFRWDMAVRGNLATGSSAGALVRQVNDYDVNQIQMSTATTSDPSFSGMVHWFTAEDWPTSLPASAMYLPEGTQ